MTQIELLVKLGRYDELIDLIKQTISRYLETNIDLTFVFLKAVNKKLSQISDSATQKALCQFTLEEIIKKLVEMPVSN
jgi:hypothetical protein